MDLNETQESSLQLVFHFADKNNLELIDLKDLRAVIQFLTSAAGKDELEELGGLSKATAGVILRELITLEAQGMEKFFGEPEFNTAELLRTAPDGRGVVSCLEPPTLQTKPMLFSTFLMWLLATYSRTCRRPETSTSLSSCSSWTRRTCCSTAPRRCSLTPSPPPSGLSGPRVWASFL